MPALSVFFLVIAAIAAVLGFGGIVVGVMAGMVKMLFLIFTVLFLVHLIIKWIGKEGNAQSR